MRPISVWLNWLFNALLPEVDKLFAVVMSSAGVFAEWAHRSWIMRSSAEVIPLLQAWNQLYYARSFAASDTPPSVQTLDNERLYTNVEMAEIHDDILQLVRDIFDLGCHAQDVGIRVQVGKSSTAQAISNAIA